MLRIVRMMYSKSMIREVFFAVEILLMVLLLSIAILPISNELIYVRETSRLLGGADDEYIFCAPPSAVNEPIDPYDIAAKHPEIERVYRTSLTDVKMGETHAGTDDLVYSDNANLITISDEMLDDIGDKIKFSYGSFSDQIAVEAVPVVISNSLSTIYSVGEEFEIWYRVASNDISYEDVTLTCIVTGVLSKDSVMLSLVDIGDGSDWSYPLLSINLGFTEESMDSAFIFTAYDPEKLPQIDFNNAAMFKLKNGTKTQQLLDELNNEYDVFEKFESVAKMKENTSAKIVKNSKWTLLLLFLFMIVVVFNYIGYIVINIRRNQRKIAILNICGLSFMRSVIASVVSNLLIVVPAAIIGIIISPYMLNALGVTQFAYYSYNTYYFISVIALFLITALIGVFVATVRKRSSKIINLYREG